jgi:hypothetical protein
MLVYVKCLVSGGPADQSGRIQPGDVLQLVNGEDIYGQGLDLLREKIPGPAGSMVKLGFRNSAGLLYDVHLARTAYGDQQKERAWGERYRTFYHGTSLEAAMNIQKVGFDVQRSGSNAGAALGQGLYVSTTLEKALNYAKPMPCQGAIFELRVQLGRCYKVTDKADRNKQNWQQMGFDSAWAPDGTIGVREENCIKDPRPPRVVIHQVFLGHTWTANKAGYWIDKGKLRKR